MNAILWSVGALLCGSLPFSVLVARFALKTDIRTIGDGNPGATNVFRAGGGWWGIVALALDYLKGALPVGIAYFLAAIDGATLVVVAVAPVVGHAFSPWLGFRGGKAVATTFGVWSGLTWWYIPTLFGLLLALGHRVLDSAGWAVVLAFIGVGVHLALYNPQPVLLAVWAANTAILAWKHRADLATPPALSPALSRSIRRERP